MSTVQWKPIVLAASGLALIALLFGACNMGEGCACGADTSDSLAEHDLSFAGSHTVDDECVCQCGNDIPFGLSRDRSCSEYNGACTDSQGSTQTLVCE